MNFSSQKRGRKKNKKRDFVLPKPLSLSGVTRNRTRDTRIFSPLLYQLSYDTFIWDCKYTPIFNYANRKNIFLHLLDSLNKNMELYRYVGDNGIRLVYHRTPGVVAHCGLMINTGSRDENPEEGEHGAAHFIEHMFFKGTSKRKSYHILSYLDDSGGELNAYTTKEETAIYASILKEDIERAMNIISDIVFNSTFPAKEIEKEKDVIIEEINSYLDNPGEMIYDDFENLVLGDILWGELFWAHPTP